MLKKFGFAVLFWAVAISGAEAQTCGVLPYTLANGTTADADQVNDNFTSLLTCANGSLAPLNAPIFTGAVTVGTGGSSSSFTVVGAGGAFTAIPGGTISLKSFNATSTPFVVNLAAAAPVIADFQDNGSSVLAIANGGRVGIGTTAPSLNLYVNGTAGGTSAWSSPSDIRLKKNIVPIQDALSIVEKLRGVRFDWRAPNERSIGQNLDLPLKDPQIGLIAQEVRKVVPEAVTVPSDPKAPLSVSEAKLVPVLIEAIKEQALQIAQLQRDVEKLKRRQTAQNSTPVRKTASR
ncbi:MAG TPA: tail fiber domain-containing protein [Rhizomicrobium sp.]